MLRLRPEGPEGTPELFPSPLLDMRKREVVGSDDFRKL